MAKKKTGIAVFEKDEDIIIAIYVGFTNDQIVKQLWDDYGDYLIPNKSKIKSMFRFEKIEVYEK